jgi:predicted dehydrogenase
LGNIGAKHATEIATQGGEEFRLAAVCSDIPEQVRKVSAEFGVKGFSSIEELCASGECDAVVLATPHYLHAPQAILAARAGLHVLTEKPLSVTIGPARAMVAEFRRRRLSLGGMFQHRVRSIILEMKRRIDAGDIGDIFRISLISTFWYRPQAYFDSASWRGTWDGEGGGVLINQAPHSLDVFQWLGGMPTSVQAVVDTRLHKIEVEDTASALCRYKDGRNGYIHVSTAEAPGFEQLYVYGDKGSLIAEGNKLRFCRLSDSISHHSRTCRKIFKGVREEWKEIPVEDNGNQQHILMIRNFAAHLLRGEKLICDGRDALNELELTNAIYLSGYTGKSVELPVDEKAMEKLFDRLVRERSTGKGGDIRGMANRQLRKMLRK